MPRVRPKQSVSNPPLPVKSHWFGGIACALVCAVGLPAEANPNAAETTALNEGAKPIHVAAHVRKLALVLEPERVPDDRPYHTWVRRAEAAHGISADLIHAIIKVESRYNPKAVSDAGAKGLMQLMPRTAAQCGVRNVFDPAQNIFGGALYLHKLAQHFRGDLVLTLAAYHAGPGAVWEARGVPSSLRTRAYVRAVVAEYARELARHQTQPANVATRDPAR